MSSKTKLLLGLLVVVGGIAGAFYLSGDDSLIKGSLTATQTACKKLQVVCSKNPKTKGCEKIQETCARAGLKGRPASSAQSEATPPAPPSPLSVGKEVDTTPPAQAAGAKLSITLDTAATPSRTTATGNSEQTFVVLRFAAANAPITVNKLSFIANVDDGNVSSIRSVMLRDAVSGANLTAAWNVTPVDDHVGLVSFSQTGGLFTVQPGEFARLSVVGSLGQVSHSSRMTVMLYVSLNNTAQEIEITTPAGRFSDSMDYMPNEINFVEANHFAGLFTPNDKIIRGNEVVGINEAEYAASQPSPPPGGQPSPQEPAQGSAPAPQGGFYPGDNGTSTGQQQQQQPPQGQYDYPPNYLPSTGTSSGQTGSFYGGTSTQQ